VIAGKHTETAGVDGKRFVQAELGREIGDLQFGFIGVILVEPAVFLEVALIRFVEPVQLCEIAVVGGGSHQLGLLNRAEHFHGIVVDLFPELAVEAAEELDGIGVPDPPEIVRQFQ
jgi:hypothetical protein